MSWHPATKIQMSNWEYFSIKMKFEDFFNTSGNDGDDLISFQTDVTPDGGMPSVLDNWLQRKINEGRAKKEIARYLLDRKDAFFSSIVIACLGDIPEFRPAEIEQSELDNLGLMDLQDLGFIRFDRTQKYMVLDGQHRLFAIKSIIEDKELREEMAPGFLDQGLNVLLVNKGSGEDYSDFKEKYRRLFTSLNRYAKSTNKETNIIMDEDDIFAIITRKMIQDSKIFKFDGKAENNPHIDIDTKAISQGATYLTSLATLYDVNTIFLQNQIVKSINPMITKKDYLMHRPSEADINFYYNMVDGIWNALIEHFPDLNDVDKRVNMRSPNEPLDSEGKMDHLFLRPKPQIDIMAKLIRHLIESRLSSDGALDNDEIGNFSPEQYSEALKPLTWIDWDMRKPPFMNLILVNNSTEPGETNYVMTEGATSVSERMAAAYEVCLFLIDDKQTFQPRAITRLSATAKGAGEFNTQTEANEWWEKVLEIKNNINYG